MSDPQQNDAGCWMLVPRWSLTVRPFHLFRNPKFLAQTLAQTGIMGLVDQFKQVAPGRAWLTGYVLVY